MDRQSITNEEATEQLYQLGGRVLEKDIADVVAQADRVRSIFGKVGKLSGYVKDVVNTLSLLKDYASGEYTQVPWRIVAALTGAVFYVFNPLDLIPDLVPLFGFADDATVFAAVMSFAHIDIASYLDWKTNRGETIEGGGKSGIVTIHKSEDITNWTLTDFVQVIQNALRSIGNDSLFWCCCGADHMSQNSSNIIEKIMGGNGNINDVIGVIDMEAFQHCKEGFAFTRDRVYFRQFMGESFSFAWREIVSIQYEGKEVIINGIRLDNICRNENDARTICKMLTAIANRADLTPEPEPYDESRYVPISEAIVRRFATVDGGGLLFAGDNIPFKRRMGAHKAMNIQESPEDICLLFDASPFGSGKTGFALTSKAMYCKDFFSSPARHEWGLYKWVANPTSFWLMCVNNQPYYEISGGILNANQISAIVDALNEFQMYDMKEKGRSIEAHCKRVLEQIDACEKLVDQVGNEGKDINSFDKDTENDSSKTVNSVGDVCIDNGDKSSVRNDLTNQEKSSQQLENKDQKKVSSKKTSRSTAKMNATTTPRHAKTKSKNGPAQDTSVKKKAEKNSNDAPKTYSKREASEVKVEESPTVIVKRTTAKKNTKSLHPKSADIEKMSVGDAIKKSIAESSDTNIYVGEAIPAKKLNNAIACMGVRVGEDVYALIDTTWFGSGKTGLIFTSLGIHWKNDWTTDTVKTMLNWTEMKTLAPQATYDTYDLRFSDDAVVDLAGSGVEPLTLKVILEKIVELI